MAKQLYDYWFVQFDFPNEEGKPYKSSGGKMVWNEKLKREIPEGWNISLIKDIATTYSGGTPKSTNIEYYDNGEIAWINSGELNSPIITKTTNYITKCGLENSSAKLYPSNSILSQCMAQQQVKLACLHSRLVLIKPFVALSLQ